MADPLEIAIRAEERAKAAHARLDRMNGSIDRLTEQVARSNATANEILRRMDREEAHDEGADQVSRGLIDSRRFLITTVVLVLSSSVVSLFATLVLRTHL